MVQKESAEKICLEANSGITKNVGIILIYLKMLAPRERILFLAQSHLGITTIE